MIPYARRIDAMAETAAIVGGLFGAMTDPNMISFGGGAPAKEALPVEIVRELSQELLTRESRGVEALQYGPIAGTPDLRQAIIDHLLAPKGMRCKMENVMVVAGGLEGINLICQTFIDPGDVILVESPTFVHTVEIFDMFQARCVPVRMDENGLIPEDLEEKIQAHHPKMIYTVPTFQNPSGRTLSLPRRKRVAELAAQYDVLVLEDDPYRDIRYSGEDLAPIQTFDTVGNVIVANSFSKIFSPGCRLGYVVAPAPVIEKLTEVKSATNSHSSMLPQVLCAEFFNRGCYPAHHRRICDLYRERRDTMIAAVEKYFPDGTKYSYPDGGLFTWVELPGGLDTAQLLKKAVARGVAYVAGAGFFVERDGTGSNCMRLSFGGNPPERIEEGMRRLGALIAEELEARENG